MANMEGVPKRVINPYAKKASTNQQQQASARSKDPPPQQSATLKPVEIGVSATFSQAFASVDDTSHFQKEASSLRANKNTREDKDNNSAAQRAFDQAAAAVESDSTTTATATDLTDRDHHALLQPHVLHVSTKQRGNGILKHIRNVPFAFSKMVPDYIVASGRCALFLSVKYHNLYPQYIHRRIAELKSDFTLRVLLVLVDVEDNAATLHFLNTLAVKTNLTLVLAWSEEEAARYLETYKAFDGKDASSIQKREQSNFVDQVSDVLCSVKSVNKTDVASLMGQFGSLRAIVAASMDELGLCNGMGDKKVRRLYDAFHKPFSSQRAKRRKVETTVSEEEREDEVHTDTRLDKSDVGDEKSKATPITANIGKPKATATTNDENVLSTNVSSSKVAYEGKS